MRDDFGVLIITHQRPHNQTTLELLRKSGYTGPVWLVIDDDDPTADEYRELFGDKVLVFSKKEVAESFDEGDNFHDYRAGVYARNACWDFARELGLRFYIQIDDDINNFQWRLMGVKDGTYKYGSWKIDRLDDVLEAMIEFVEDTDTQGFSVSLGGDHIGGVKNTHFGLGKIVLRQKPMGWWLVATDRPFPFIGRMNDDVNTYMTLGNRGGLFFAYSGIQMNTPQTQSQSGGMTDIYLARGTYQKSFYTAMMGPSYTEIRTMGPTNRRIHHSIRWNRALPKIVREGLRK